MKKIEIYDTTLRDGTQGEGVFFTLQDKIKITEILDNFGVDFIEGGWPGSNPKDIKFFERIKRKKFKKSKIVAFGSTRRKKFIPEKDPLLKKLLESETEYIMLFGKSWDLHVTCILRVSLDENLKMIDDSIKYLISKGREVFFDAEHFFDGYKRNPEYALKTLIVAEQAGAKRIILCDTNGGTLPFEVERIIKEVKKEVKAPLGIHTHNDSGVAIANSIVAVKEGCIQVHGTINGIGERCGNADLTSIIPILQLKMGYKCVEEKKVVSLTEVSRKVYELANMVPVNNQPFVGLSAFSHKGGVHIDAVSKNVKAYEHINPAVVGNERKFLISELSGKSTILQKLKGYNIEEKPELVRKILNMVGELENEGYQFESAEGSFELMVSKSLGKFEKFFEIEGFRVIVEKRGKKVVSEATVKVKLDKLIELTASEGNGPVNALDNALRKALEKIYPEIKSLKLTDYRVRILHPEKATGALTRVIIQSVDEKDSWGTIGVSPNIIEASWKALLDSFEYKLYKDKKKKNES